MNVSSYLHKNYSSNNEILLKSSKKATCFYCLNSFEKEKIKEFVSGEELNRTAICPICGIDSIIPDIAFEDEKVRMLLITEMSEKFFSDIYETRKK